MSLLLDQIAVTVKFILKWINAVVKQINIPLNFKHDDKQVVQETYCDLDNVRCRRTTSWTALVYKMI